MDRGSAVLRARLFRRPAEEMPQDPEEFRVQPLAPEEHERPTPIAAREMKRCRDLLGIAGDDA